MTSSHVESQSSNIIPMLRTADQHDAWRARVLNKCWALTGVDILAVTDNTCVAALTKLHGDDAKADELTKFGWVTKCWLTITSTLSDDILMKVAHVERGSIETLLKEIAASLTVYTQDEADPLRLQIYGCTMQKCDSDLQSYIAYFQIRQRKLTFLKKPVAESDLVSLFINGLHPILTPLKIHLRIIAPTKWDEVVNVVRIHCASPEVSAELAKLKSAGLSQHMFSMTTQPTPQKQTQPCKNFARGHCNYGDRCQFTHAAIPSENAPVIQQSKFIRCAFCFNKGHVALDCRNRLAQLEALSEPPPETQKALFAQSIKCQQQARTSTRMTHSVS